MIPEQPLSPLRTAVIAQTLGAIIAIGLIALAFPRFFVQPLAVAVLQGLCAAFTSHKLDAPPWWLPIHLAFMPLVVLASSLGLHPAWYLAAFTLLLLVFWRTDKSRVPLYLSNEMTAAAIAALLPSKPCKCIDLGCGNGGLLRMMARRRPDCRFLGVEHAPLPWLWARLACAGLPNCRIRYGDFWHQPLKDFDVAYVFLSPVPMPRLWEKTRAEMAGGSLLVSNSFAVPGVPPEQVIEIADRRATRLFCYRPANQFRP